MKDSVKQKLEQEQKNAAALTLMQHAEALKGSPSYSEIYDYRDKFIKDKVWELINFQHSDPDVEMKIANNKRHIVRGMLFIHNIETTLIDKGNVVINRLSEEPEIKKDALNEA